MPKAQRQVGVDKGQEQAYKACGCGCGESFKPARKDQRFLNRSHRDNYYSNQKHPCPKCGLVHIPLMEKK